MQHLAGTKFRLATTLSVRHGSQFRSQLFVASPTNRPQPKFIIIVIIKLKLWPATGCEAKVAAELSSHS